MVILWAKSELLHTTVSLASIIR